MLNIKKFSQIGLVAVFVFILGCKEKSAEPETTPTDNKNYGAINNWIYGVMNETYFWYKQMPAENSLDSSIEPDKYFEKLIYQRTATDRFSAITSDFDALTNEFNGVKKSFGTNYTLSFADESKTTLAAFISYIVKGSPAETAGLKRGDIIMKVNGTQLTPENYVTLLGSNETATFTLGTLNGTVLVADNTKTFTITKAVVSEDPVLFSSVLSKTAYGKTIGYLVYTQFIAGTATDEKKYDDELRQVFADFKSKGVNELVLDLRFNPGGYISSAGTLASLTGRNVSNSKIFYKEQMNDKYTAFWQSKFGANALNYNFGNEANNIGANLSRVFVLTSKGTASASELVINGLKPYMDVITIGDHTYGKNLFGTLIGDEQKRWKWGLYVMLGQTANANDQSDYGTVNGIAPTYQVQDNVIPYKPLGDENETLLRKVLDVIGIPAPGNVRTTATKEVTAFINETLKGNPVVQEKRMIKDRP